MIWPDDPSNDSSKCPAIILAVRRIAKVKGRIIRLIDSIITIKGIRMKGVPWGVRWEKKSFIKLKMLNIIILNHKVRDKERQNLKWLEAVKI